MKQIRFGLTNNGGVDYMDNSNKYFWVYICMVFGVAWSIMLVCGVFAEQLRPWIGELSMTHPIITFVLYLPSLTGLGIYYFVGGGTAIKGIFEKLIPEKRDLIWFPILFAVFAIFALTMHFGSKFLDVKVPTITFTPLEMVTKALWNFIEETGLLGGIFGWVGFLLPYLQGKFKSNIRGALLTGLIFGLWVLPGYGLSSIAVMTSYLLYVMQLMAFMVFASYIFNATRGNLTFYLFSFWIAATGSHIQLYYFNTPVQVMEIIYLVLISIITQCVFRLLNKDVSLQVFPDFVFKYKNEPETMTVPYSHSNP